MLLFVPALAFGVAHALQHGAQVSSDEFTFDCARPFLIYGEAKTGTTTMAASFEQYCNMSVVLTRGQLPAEWPRAIRCNGNTPVCEGFLDRFANEEMTVVTMVRNPFERLISLYFQVAVRKYFESGSDKASLSYTEKEFPQFLHDRANVPTSFYDEWQENLNMSFGQIKLDSNGDLRTHFWKARNGGRVYNIILLKVESPYSWEQTLRPKLPNWKLITKYEAATKDYAELYDKFKQNFVWTHADVEMVKGHWLSVLDTFYTTKEKEDMVAYLNVGDEEWVRASRERNQEALSRDLDGLTRQTFGDLLDM